jgi:WD40 repeat protein
VAISPNGDFVISASDDHTLRLWSLPSVKGISSLENHSKPITAVAIDLNGKQAISTSLDENIVIWDLKSGLPINLLKVMEIIEILLK